MCRMQESTQTRSIEFERNPFTFTKSALALFVIDRLLKLWAYTNPINTVPLIGQWIRLELYLNFNVTFGIPLTWNTALTIISLVLLVFLIGLRILNIKHRKPQNILILDLIIAGAASNIMDRLTHHAVIDYIALWPWSYINLADIMILVALYLAYKTYDRTPTRA